MLYLKHSPEPMARKRSVLTREVSEMMNHRKGIVDNCRNERRKPDVLDRILELILNLDVETVW